MAESLEKIVVSSLSSASITSLPGRCEAILKRQPSLYLIMGLCSSKCTQEI